MLKGDCNICRNRNLPDDSEACSLCGLSRVNYEPMRNFELILSSSGTIIMADRILKLVNRIPEGDDKRRCLVQLLEEEVKW